MRIVVCITYSVNSYSHAILAGEKEGRKMQRIVHRFLSLLQLLGLIALGALIAAMIVALWHHIIDSPRPLESALPGEARLYRWKHGHIFYKVLGAADAPPLVLLHAPGIGASTYEMRKIMEPLAQQYRVYVPDLLGFGLSDRPHIDYSAETYETLCHDFLADVVTGPATLLASGLSCNYAVAMAAQFPELCKGLILISPTTLSVGEQARKQDRQRKLLQVPLVGLILYPLMSTRPALRYTIKRQHLDYTMSELDYLYATTHQLGAQHAPLALLAGKLTQDVSQHMETLQQPTLIICTLNNSHPIPHQLSAKAQVVLLRDSGRYVHEERPETVAANVQKWSKVCVTSTSAAEEHAAEVASIPVIDTSEAGVTSMSAAGEDIVEVVSIPVIDMSEPPITSMSAAEEDATDVVSTSVVEAYCVKCKKKVPMQNPQGIIMKNGRPALRGTCPVCGTGLHRIGRT